MFSGTKQSQGDLPPHQAGALLRPGCLRRAGVLKEEERLAGLFAEHLAGPAIDAAEPAQSSYGAPRRQHHPSSDVRHHASYPVHSCLGVCKGRGDFVAGRASLSQPCALHTFRRTLRIRLWR